MEENKNVEEVKTVEDTANLEKEVKMEKKAKKKRNTGRVIFNIIVWIFFLIVIVEATIGIINMQKINNDEKPIWYISMKEKKTEDKTQTIYNLGLYKIVKTDTAKQTKTSLKPFFIGD